MDVASHTFLITGAGSGLGAATARVLAAGGANVVLLDLNDAAGQALQNELGDRALFARTDVTSEEQVKSAIESARKTFGALHGVVNCAGILAAARVCGKNGPHDLGVFARVVQVNLIGTFNVMRLAAAAMIGNPPGADGERGVIVNTSSVAAFEGQIGQAAYAASKGGVASMTLPAARELARFGIRVVAIAPGMFATAMMAPAPEEVRDSLVAQTPFPERPGEPSEFARLVRDIIENRMLNGCVIRLDGALRMGPK